MRGYPGLGDQNSRGIDFDLVAAGTLRAIERVIRLMHQQGEFRRLFALESTSTETRSDRHVFAVKRKLFRGKTLAEAFDSRFDIALADMRQYQQKFIAAHSPADIRCPRIFFEDRGKFLQHLIASIVAIAIVDILEGVQVRVNHPQGIAMLRRAVAARPTLRWHGGLASP